MADGLPLADQSRHDVQPLGLVSGIGVPDVRIRLQQRGAAPSWRSQRVGRVRGADVVL